MTTKSRKKSSKKTTKTRATKTAQIQLDPATVHQFESHLREGLVASGAVMMSTETPKLKPGARVELDADTTAHVAEVLRKGLVSSGAVLATEYPKQPSKRRPTAKGKKSGSAPTKKR